MKFSRCPHLPCHLALRALALFLGLLAGGAGTLTAPAVDAPRGPDIRRDAVVLAVEQVLSSVVNIATATVNRPPPNSYLGPVPGDDLRVSMGSGVIIDEEGYLLTNNHVVRGSDKIWVKPATATNFYEATIAALDPKTDLALLKIQHGGGARFVPVKFGGDDDLFLGETVLALGNPFGLGGSVSRGILSSKSRVPPEGNAQLDIPNWLQTDAAINQGNSGGPLVNLRGELIGLNVAVLTGAQGIGFAIPTKRLVEALTDMITPESSTNRLWFGAQIRAGGPPFVITAVQADSPADKAGMRAGDALAEINGVRPKGFISLNEHLLVEPNAPVRLALERDGKRREVTVRMVPLNTVFNGDYLRKRLGLVLRELPRRTPGYPGDALGGGLLVTAIDRGAKVPPDLTTGVIITEVEGSHPFDLTDAARLLSHRRPGENVHLQIVKRVPGLFGGYGSASRQVEMPVR